MENNLDTFYAHDGATPAKALLEYSHFGYMWTNVKTKKIVASHTVYDMLGIIPFSELLNTNIWKTYVHKEDLYRLLQAEEVLFEGKNVTSIEYRMITKSGKVIFVNHRMQLSVGQDNEIKILSVLDDITELKQAEIILEVMNEAFIELNEHFCFRRINAKTEIYWGIKRTDVVGKCIEDIFPQVKDTSFYHLITTAAKEKRNIAADVTDSLSGRWLHVSASAYNDGVLVMFYDIENEKASEMRIQDQANYIERITQTVPGMISVMELETGKVEYINDDVFRAHGFDPEKMKHTSRAELRKATHEEDHKKLNNYYAAFQNAKDNEVVTADYRAINDSGTWHWYRVRGKVFRRNAEGKVTHIVNNVENITKEKEAEEKIMQLNNMLTFKNRELESANTEIKTFNSIAATDYKETLRQLYTSLEYIISHDAKNLSASGKANIRRAQSGIQKMKLLTDDIVSFSNIQSLDSNISSVNLNDIIKNEVAALQEKNKMFDVDLHADELPSVKGYPLLVSLLFHHLFDNAIKFRKQGMELQINITCTKVENPEFDDALANTSYYRIAFTDNGIGFDQYNAEKIFTMFYKLHDKSKYRGSGIGLAICKKVMDLHHGFITAESAEGNGATFICFFPENIQVLN